ncbi:MAG: small basic family protein [Patescibacteria group bacterium]
MLYIIVGLLVGVLAGAVLPFNIPIEYAQYSAVAILALIDSLVQALTNQIEGRYNLIHFVFNLVFYSIIAIFFVYLGTKMNLDLYLGIIIVFLLRIMQNVEMLREYYFHRLFKDKREKEG